MGCGPFLNIRWGETSVNAKKREEWHVKKNLEISAARTFRTVVTKLNYIQRECGVAKKSRAGKVLQHFPGKSFFFFLNENKVWRY